jgi:hypothetical protein
MADRDRRVADNVFAGSEDELITGEPLATALPCLPFDILLVQVATACAFHFIALNRGKAHPRRSASLRRISPSPICGRRIGERRDLSECMRRSVEQFELSAQRRNPAIRLSTAELGLECV